MYVDVVLVGLLTTQLFSFSVTLTSDLKHLYIYMFAGSVILPCSLASY